MADWDKPTITDLYTDVLDYLASKDEDAYTLAESPTNPPTGAIKYVRASNKFMEWNGSSWVDRTISVAGGGTGATTASGARTALGLGTMSTQNSNAVAITAGTLSGITSLELSGPLTFDGDGTRKIGAYAKRVDTVYIKNGLVIPVGADLWVTA